MWGVIVTLAVAILSVMTLLLIVAVGVEPIAVFAKQYVGPEYDAIIDTVVVAMAQWAPVIIIGGLLGAWGVAWLVRRERYSGRGGGGGGGFR